MKKNRTGGESGLDVFAEICRRHGLRVTPQRTAIYMQLAGAGDHPNADALFGEIRKQFPNISLDTVNRTLLTFAEIGLVSVVEGRGEPKRFDPDLTPHHHARCMKCGTIFDFCNETYDSLRVPEKIKKKMTVCRKRVVLEGVCIKCKKDRNDT